jgi:hypothetical protein
MLHAMAHLAELPIDQAGQDAFLVWLGRQGHEVVRASDIDDVRTAAAEAQASRVMSELWARVFCDRALA